MAKISVKLTLTEKIKSAFEKVSQEFKKEIPPALLHKFEIYAAGEEGNIGVEVSDLQELLIYTRKSKQNNIEWLHELTIGSKIFIPKVIPPPKVFIISNLVYKASSLTRY
jgi:hypothetical protein